MMLKENRRLARDVLDGMSLDDAAAHYDKSRARCWQITISFCLEYFLLYELYDDDGKMRNLKGLRKFWRDTLKV